jgi:S1-C subfamily serine protease
MVWSRALMASLLIAAGFAAGAGWSSRGGSRGDGEAVPRQAAPRPSLTAAEANLSTLFERAAPSVAYITSIAVRRDLFRLNVLEIPRGTGSGFVWDERGHVVTNFHVIQDADAAEVTLADQSTWKASLIGVARDKDLAVLHIDAPPGQLKPIPVGTSHDLKVGQTVLAIGNPFGFDHTLTTGIISALGREIESVDRLPIRDVIQTDAAINPGNSGGPLLDSAGRLIGVNTAIYSPSGSYAGIGFAIPVDTVNWVVPDLIAYGQVRRPVLGVELATEYVNQRLGIEGALVVNVEHGSGAERAGLRPTQRTRRGDIVLGDLIVSIDGDAVRAPSDIRLLLERRTAGEVVRLEVVRDGDHVEVPVTLEW